MSWREDRKHSVGFGKEQFPHRPSRRIKETTFVTCRQCGFALDTKTTAWSKTGYAGTPPSVDGPGGCPLCRSMYWAPSKPQLKDGNDTDAKRSDRRRLR